MWWGKPSAKPSRRNRLSSAVREVGWVVNVFTGGFLRSVALGSADNSARLGSTLLWFSDKYEKGKRHPWPVVDPSGGSHMLRLPSRQSARQVQEPVQRLRPPRKVHVAVAL